MLGCCCVSLAGWLLDGFRWTAAAVDGSTRTAVGMSAASHIFSLSLSLSLHIFSSSITRKAKRKKPKKKREKSDRTGTRLGRPFPPFDWPRPLWRHRWPSKRTFWPFDWPRPQWRHRWPTKGTFCPLDGLRPLWRHRWSSKGTFCLFDWPRPLWRHRRPFNQKTPPRSIHTRQLILDVEIRNGPPPSRMTKSHPSIRSDQSDLHPREKIRSAPSAHQKKIKRKTQKRGL